MEWMQVGKTSLCQEPVYEKFWLTDFFYRKPGKAKQACLLFLVPHVCFTVSDFAVERKTQKRAGKDSGTESMMKPDIHIWLPAGQQLSLGF